MAPHKKPENNLTALPEELVCHIAAQLNAQDLLALRSTCRAIEHKSFYAVGRRFFSSCTLPLTSGDLAAFRPKLKQFRFARFTKKITLDSMTLNVAELERAKLRIHFYMDNLAEDSDTLEFRSLAGRVEQLKAAELDAFYHEEVAETLIDILIHLPNLDTVNVSSSWCSDEDEIARSWFNGEDGEDGELRDVLHAPFHPWAFTAVLEALHWSKLAPTNLTFQDECCALFASNAFVPLNGMKPLRDSHHEVLSHIKTLSLGCFEGMTNLTSYNRVREYVTSCKSLQDLKLWGTLEHARLGAKILDLLSSPTMVFPPTLRKLELCDIQVDETCLTAIFCKLEKSLSSVAFAHCIMTSGHRWKSVLEFLRDQKSKLEQLRFNSNGQRRSTSLFNYDSVILVEFEWSYPNRVLTGYTGDRVDTGSGDEEELLNGGYEEIFGSSMDYGCRLEELVEEKGLRRALIEAIEAIREPES